MKLKNILNWVGKFMNNFLFNNDLAKKNGYYLLRFWEEDIKKRNFKQFLLNEIKKYGKNED